MKKEDLSIGMPVHYQPTHGLRQNGIVKSFHETDPNIAFVVYSAGGDWDNYMNYTGESTGLEYLKPGWFVDMIPRRIKSITEAYSMQPITMSVTIDEPPSNGGKANSIKFITLEKVTFGETEDQWMYCGYNFYAERVFQFIATAVNVIYFSDKA